MRDGASQVLLALARSVVFLQLIGIGVSRLPAQTFSVNDTITFKCKANNAYVTVQVGSGLNLAANRPSPAVLQQFDVRDGGSGSYALQARLNGSYVAAESAGAAPLVANRAAIGPWEQYDFEIQPDGSFAWKARVNGLYVTASQGNLIASENSPDTDWERFTIQTNTPLAPIRWRVVKPAFSPEELLVAACTPQEYGARGDGTSDDTPAFQDALSTVATLGGGAVFVPAAAYAFQGTLNIPDGVTLHGDWLDWTKQTTGVQGTLFKVYGGKGESNGTPFMFLSGSTGLKGVTIWYPEQNPTNIVAYPFCIGEYGDNAIQNVILVNPYQGIQVTPPSGGAKHIFSTLIGTPLFKGLDLDMIADISHLEDLRFNPDVWPASKLPGAPASGGPHAAWMRANGTGIRIQRIDGEIGLETFISGYKIGLEANHSTNGPSGATFYSGSISNCGTALLAVSMAGQTGLMFTRFDFDGDTCVNSQPVNDAAYLQFHTCRFTARNGYAAILGGDWPSRIQFQNCTINGRLQLNKGVFSIVNSSLNVSNGQTHLSLSTDGSDRAALVGCNFSPARSFYNPGSIYRLMLDGRRAIPNTMPDVGWSKIKQDYLSRQPARTNLFVVTNSPWNAKGDGTTDDTTAIQNALNSAAAGGGGLVFLPPGKYRLLGSLDVPSGVELRGTYELRHRTWPGQDGKAKGAILQPYAHPGESNGPPAVALEANSGLVGVTFSYESQSAAQLTVYPPTIQGRGGNIYVIGAVSPNSWYYVDLDTFRCTNHLLYMVDGFALRKGFVVGNGSSGSIVDCHANWTYWIDNYDSQSCLGYATPAQIDSVQNYIEHNNEAYILGDCTELLVKNFWIFTRVFTRFVPQNGRGPSAICLSHMCDVAVEGFRFEAAGPSSIDVINPTMAVFSHYGDLAPIGISSLSTFTGQARFFNSSLFAQPVWDIIVGGGDLRFELLHMFDHSINGTRVDGGTLHLVNKSSWIAYDQTFPVYQIMFGTNAGVPGRISEVVACSASNGVQYTNANPANAVQGWINFPLLTLMPTIPYELAPPQLSASRNPVNGDQILAWPGNIGYFGLLENHTGWPGLTWTATTNGQTYSNGQWIVTLPSSSETVFYRLRAP